MTDGRTFSDRQRFFWLKLIRTPQVGPATFRDLVNRFGSAEAALALLPDLVRKSGSKRMLQVPADAVIERELRTAERFGARFVALGESGYPANLAAVEAPPPILAVWGRTEAMTAATVAIVGARNASLNGMKLTRRLAAELGREGYCVASGLARGIDTAAHQGALDTGTVAVLAGGLDRPYPPENVPLLREIVERGGAAVSEMPFGWEPRAQDFPRRNRIIAGLALGLLVVEAAQRSGSLISARLAGEMGRLIFAVPGNPLDPRAAGTNAILKQGATLVTETGDIVEGLRPLSGGKAVVPPRIFELPPDFSAEPEPTGDTRGRLMEALGPSPTPVDELMAETGVPAGQVFTILLELDLAGRLERHPGNQVSLLAEEFR